MAVESVKEAFAGSSAFHGVMGRVLGGACWWGRHECEHGDVLDMGAANVCRLLHAVGVLRHTV